MILNLFKACRPQTLIIGILPILMTYQILALNHSLSVSTLIYCLIGVICLQSASNIINDLIDGTKGVDEYKEGAERMLASGKLSAFSLKALASFFLLAAPILCLPLIIENSALIPIIFLSVFGAISYTAKPLQLSYRGLGELAAFFFFGIISTLGTTIAFNQTYSYQLILLSLFLGFAAALILGANNLRDIQTDAKSNKRTLAVRLGLSKFKILMALIIILKSAFFIALIIELNLSRYTLLSLVFPTFLLFHLITWRSSKARLFFGYTLFSFISCSVSLLFALKLV